MDNIVLCGFMGCGKTTVGRELANILKYEYIDMDEYIVKKAGLSVSRIFSKLGETHFRALETEAAADLSKSDRLVISSGGGAVLKDENVKLFKAGGLIVFIDVPLNVIKVRLDGDITRPLLNRPDRDETMLELYNKRTPIYRAAADITVKNANNIPALMIAQAIADRIKSN